MNPFSRLVSILSITAAPALFLTGCGSKSDESESSDGLTKIILQTDWYAQPEHGGFYQALTQGYYKEVGLDVEIVPGGPNALPSQKVAQGVAHFAIGRSDDVIIASSRGVPLVIAGALMQRDPQAILFHKESGIEKFEDLDGKTVMTTPGSAMIRILEAIYDIKIHVTPLDYGMNRYLADKNFIQQCFITNEPYYVKREGANPGTLLLSDSGFSPYRVWFTSKALARSKPEVVKAFSEASIRGWNDYLTGDRTAANALISAANPKQTDDFMAFVVASLKRNKLVTGDPALGEETGRVSVARIQTLLEQLTSIDMLEGPVTVEGILDKRLIEIDAAEQAASESDAQASKPPLTLQIGSGDSAQMLSIPWDDIAALPTSTVTRKFVENGELHEMEIVYLQSLIDTYLAESEWDFLVANCGDGYQSNYDPQQIAETKPFFIMKMDGLLLNDWLAQLGHPEWGPYILNVENDDSLLDPPHKNPWGVASIIATKKAEAKGWLAALDLDEKASIGRLMYVNSCASCHAVDGTMIGGSVSTRNIRMLSLFATQSESYFRNMLRAPKETNPLAELMPSYQHYSEKDTEALLKFLASIPLS